MRRLGGSRHGLRWGSATSAHLQQLSSADPPLPTPSPRSTGWPADAGKGRVLNRRILFPRQGGYVAWTGFRTSPRLSERRFSQNRAIRPFSGGCPDVSRSCGGAPSIRLSSATRRTASVAPALLLEHHKIKTGAQSTQWSRFPANWSGVETRRGSVFTSSDLHALAPRRRKRKSDQASTPYRLVELPS